MGKKQTQVPGREIYKLLADLQIDQESAAEDVALEEAQKTSFEAPPETPRIVIPAPVPPSAEDEEEEDSDADEPESSNPFPDDVPSLPRAFVPPPQNSGKGPRAQARDKPGIKGISKTLVDKLPGSDKIKVFKRDNVGKRWFVATYTTNDLKAFPDAESFLTQYVKPRLGAGEYDIVTVDAANRETEAGTVRLIEDSTQTPESNMVSLVEKILTESRSRDQEYRQLMQTPQQNPLDLLKGVLTLKNQLDGEVQGGNGAAMAALTASGDKTVQMMMMMMQMQQQAAQQQMQTLMAVLSKPKDEDPTMKLILAKLLEERSSGGGGMMPPPPPPPPAASPTSGLAEILTAMAGFMGAVGGGGGGDEDFKDFLKNMLLQKQTESFGPKEVVALLTQNKGGEGAGGDAFRSSIDNIAALMNVAKNLQGQHADAPGAGILDVLAALVSNRDFAGGIASAIRSKTDTKATAEMERIRIAGEALKMERRLFEQQKRQLGVIAPAGGTVHVVPQAVPQTPSAQQPTQAQRQPAVVTLEQQREAEVIAEKTGQLPQLPANTHDHINGLLESTSEADLVAKVISLLIYFAEFEEWHDFSERVLGYIREGNRTEATEYLATFFAGLADLNLLDRKRGATIVVTLHKHFSVVQQQLADMPLESDNEVTADALLAGAQNAVAP